MTADNKQQTAADGRTLVIAAAGTGGHVMPGLAVARVMARMEDRLDWHDHRHGKRACRASGDRIPSA